jgi:hypothetical protein
MKKVNTLRCDEKEISEKSLTYGMEDDELEKLSSKVKWLDKGKAPWATWESENSSFGRTFRLWWNNRASCLLWG